MDRELGSGAKRYDSGANQDKERKERKERKEKRLDLSVPQVAGSALAAIAAAVLASQLNVYGTIIGAGVVSVIATCGGSIFHYLFRRTGEHMREAGTRQIHAKGRQVLVKDESPAPVGGPELPDTLDVLGAGYGEPTTHRTKRQGWRRPVIGAVAVFLLAMICITGYELAAGHDLAGNARTTIGSVVGGGGGGGRHAPPPASPSTGSSDGGDGSDGSGGSTGPAASPSTGDGPSGGPVKKGQENGRDAQSPGTHAPSGQTPGPSDSAGDGGQGPSTSPTPTPSVSGGAGVGGQSVPGAERDGVNGTPATPAN